MEEMLIKAGALIVAELECMHADRASSGTVRVTISDPVEVRELPSIAPPSSVERSIVRELRDLLTVNDGPEGPMPPSWYLGQIRQLLGIGVTAEHDAVTLDLTGPGVEPDEEFGGES